MRTFKFLLVALSLLLFGGCASMPSPIDPNDKLDPNNGVILASVTSDNNRFVMDAWFYYRKKGSNQMNRLDAFGVAGILSKPTDYPSQNSRIGRLIALPLEPGEYELFNWTLYIRQFGGYGYLSPKSSPPPHTFTISPGTITYLGNLHIDTIVGKNIIGMEIPIGGNPDLIDGQERDFPLLQEKYPNLRGMPIKSSIPDGKLWKLQDKL